jgi:hypothetical protein
MTVLAKASSNLSENLGVGESRLLSLKLAVGGQTLRRSSQTVAPGGGVGMEELPLL